MNQENGYNNEPFHSTVSTTWLQVLLKEDVEVGTIIVVVSLNDKDLGENGQIGIHISVKLPFLS